jgi:hypothetical protein
MIASLPKDLNEKESDLLVRHGLNARLPHCLEHVVGRKHAIRQVAVVDGERLHGRSPKSNAWALLWHL